MGKILGDRWEIVKPLSEGGQATTFVVRDREDAGAPEAVLKRLKNTKRIGRFKQEVEATLKLKHDHILKLIDHNLDAREPYIVSPYCSGGTLEVLVKDGKIPPLAKCLQLFVEIADAINYAHSEKIVHRDIKPSNIFLGHPAIHFPVVGDFGLCYFAEGEDRHTETEEAVGARYFMAPELEDGRVEVIDPSVDVYSLGKLLYWLVSGGGRFSREKTREPRWDLTKIMPHDYLPGFNPAMEHVNRLLDVMIVHDPHNRGKLPEIILAAKRTLRLVALDFNPVSKDTVQHCTYCGWGSYTPVAIGSGSEVVNMGLNMVGSSNWRIMVCDKCGHVQFFRPDLAPRSTFWDR